MVVGVRDFSDGRGANGERPIILSRREFSAWEGRPIVSLFSPDVGELRCRRDIDRLVRLLGHRNPEVRAEAARALGAGDDSWPCGDTEQRPLGTSSEPLGRSPEAAGALIARLKDGSGQVREEVARALAKILDRALPPVAGDSGDLVAGAARGVLDVLDEDGAPWQAADLLVALLPVLDLELRAVAVDALHRLARFGLFQRIGEDPGGQEDLVRSLGWVGRPAVELALAGLLSEDASVDSVSGAKKVLVACGGAASALLVEAVKSGSSYYWRAAQVLREIGDSEAVETLIESLSDESMRGRAAAALGEIGDTRAVGPLIAVLVPHSGYVDADVAVALGRIGDPGAVEPLVAALGHQPLTTAVVGALETIGGARAEEVLRTSGYRERLSNLRKAIAEQERDHEERFSRHEWEAATERGSFLAGGYKRREMDSRERLESLREAEVRLLDRLGIQETDST